ncbi:hypothetical protein GOODEAATRI_025271 [Goodea atripinnis]|uniref:Secreted protein n=1 Tax=Goodea atripinnis TaxID=208336 RepID=A0ABV0PGY1_9TELE
MFSLITNVNIRVYCVLFLGLVLQWSWVCANDRTGFSYQYVANLLSVRVGHRVRLLAAVLSRRTQSWRSSAENWLFFVFL